MRWPNDLLLFTLLNWWDLLGHRWHMYTKTKFLPPPLSPFLIFFSLFHLNFLLNCSHSENRWFIYRTHICRFKSKVIRILKWIIIIISIERRPRLILFVILIYFINESREYFYQHFSFYCTSARNILENVFEI